MSGVERVLAEVAEERRAQDAKWGGPTHDDTHAPMDWFGFISDHNHRSLGACRSARKEDYRRGLIRIAALAVAAAESYDRRNVAALDAPAGSEARK